MVAIRSRGSLRRMNSPEDVGQAVSVDGKAEASPRFGVLGAWLVGVRLRIGSIGIVER